MADGPRRALPFTRPSPGLETGEERRPGGTLLRQRFVPWAILVPSLLFTFGVAGYLQHVSEQRDRARFENAVQGAYDRIDRRLDVYLATLEGVVAMWATSDTVTAEAFAAYARRLEIQQRYPGIQGIGWSERIGVELGGTVEPHGITERHSIQYLEPRDARNQAALGFDMYSEATRRTAMARARDTGRAALSGKVRLVQEIMGPEQAGFLVYLPVYQGGETPATVDERRAALRGFVYSPFRGDDLFAGIFGSERFPQVAFRVYDGREAHPDGLIHASPGTGRLDAAFDTTRTLTQGGHPWTVRFLSTPAFEAGSGSAVFWIVLLAGLAASAWLFILARGQARARIRAEAANEAKSAFLATMSHELRTPLNAIAGYVDLLCLEIPGALTSGQKAYLDRIRTAQRHLLALINDILDFAKLQAGRTRVRQEPVRIDTAVRESVGFVTAQIGEKRLDLALDGPAIRALADPERVRQILLNILSNAVKFTAPGGAIRVEWRAVDHDVEIAVSDTGIGIEPDQMETIFEPFVQVKSDLTRTHHGAGLGLAISRELARDMDGDLLVHSTPGLGSRFTLTLPLHDGRG